MQEINGEKSNGLMLVGIGASAGGIDALLRFFEHTPEESGLAFAVVLHTMPAHESRLAEVLQTKTRMPVTQLREAVRVEANRVYCVPPDRRVLLSGGHFRLVEPGITDGRLLPIDLFFPTLAHAYKDKAFAVVLSGAGDQVRVWVSGCATGEEAHSIAMLLTEHAETLPNPPALQVFAIDIDEDALTHGRTGVYPNTIAADVSPERLKRFFVKEGQYYRVKRELREAVLFAAHNILRDPPFSKLDLISCRNLLTHINRNMQERILEIFHFALRPEGYLFLGSSESAEGLSDLFKPVDKKHRIFKHDDGTAFKETPAPPVSGERIVRQTALPRLPLGGEHAEPFSYGELHYRMLEAFAPPSVLVNEDYDIVHLSEHAGRYLRLSGGEPTRNLLKVVHPDLRLELRSLLITAGQEGDTASSRVLVNLEGAQSFVRVAVRSLAAPPPGFMLVSFDEQKAASPDAEELQASNEELQSVNEELTRLNLELREKVEEVGRSNSDLRNLIASTRIATLFLDHDLRLKRYTPSAQELFNVIPADLGRPLTHITHKLDYAALADDAGCVLRDLHTVEREVSSQDGRHFLARSLPYRATDDKINGVVLTFTDITERLRAEEALRQSEERLRLVLEAATDYAIMLMDEEGRFTSWNRGAERMFGYTETEALGQPAGLIFTAEDRAAGLPEQELRTADRVGRANDERWHVRKDGSRFYVSGVLVSLRHGHGYAKIARDLTTQKETQDLLHRAWEELEKRVSERTAELALANSAMREEVRVRSRAEQERLELLRRIVTTQEDERRRISRELHDQLGQSLTALRLKLEGLKVEAGRRSKLQGRIGELLEIAQRLDSDVDFLAWELRPTALDDLGLAVALSNYAQEWARHYGATANFHSAGLGDARLAPLVETNLYRIAQEALNNISKHAEATSVALLLERRDGNAVLIVEDNGRGFDHEQANASAETRGMGLVSMRERAALVGGTVEIESTPGEGTTVFVRVPVKSAPVSVDERGQ